MLRKVLQERRSLGPKAHGSENVSHSNCCCTSLPLPLSSLYQDFPYPARSFPTFFLALSIVLAKFTLGQQAHKIVLNKKRRKQINNSIFLPQRGRGRGNGARGVSGTHTMNVKPWRMKLKIFRSILCSACTGTLTHTYCGNASSVCMCAVRLPF